MMDNETRDVVVIIGLVVLAIATFIVSMVFIVDGFNAGIFRFIVLAVPLGIALKYLSSKDFK